MGFPFTWRDTHCTDILQLHLYGNWFYGKQLQGVSQEAVMLCKSLFYTYSALNIRTPIYVLRVKDVVTKAFWLAIRRFIVNNIKYTKSNITDIDTSCQSNLHRSGVKDNLFCKSKYQNVQMWHLHHIKSYSDLKITFFNI